MKEETERKRAEEPTSAIVTLLGRVNYKVLSRLLTTPVSLRLQATIVILGKRITHQPQRCGQRRRSSWIISRRQEGLDYQEISHNTKDNTIKDYNHYIILEHLDENFIFTKDQQHRNEEFKV